jgi:predicted dehydrogenase
MGRYKAAIIGCGRIGSEFDDDPLMRKLYGIASHAGAYTENNDFLLVAASDLGREKLSFFGKRWGVSRLYESYEDLFSNERLDVVSICTPNSTHLDILRQAVASGVKAVFCEKPLSDSLENAEKMEALATQHNVTLLVNHRRRWDGLYQKVSSFIEGGFLGDIQQVSCYYNAGIANTGTHLLDVLRMFFGEVDFVSGFYRGDFNKLDPDIDGFIVFKNHVSVSLQSLDISQYLIFELDIYGTLGRIRIGENGCNLSYWIKSTSERYAGINELRKKEPPFAIPDPAMFKNAVINISEILKGTAIPICNAADGVKVLEIISALHKSAHNQGKKIFLPLRDRSFVIQSK